MSKSFTETAAQIDKQRAIERAENDRIRARQEAAWRAIHGLLVHLGYPIPIDTCLHIVMAKPDPGYSFDDARKAIRHNIVVGNDHGVYGLVFDDNLLISVRI